MAQSIPPPMKGTKMLEQLEPIEKDWRMSLCGQTCIQYRLTNIAFMLFANAKSDHNLVATNGKLPKDHRLPRTLAVGLGDFWKDHESEITGWAMAKLAEQVNMGPYYLQELANSTGVVYIEDEADGSVNYIVEYFGPVDQAKFETWYDVILETHRFCAFPVFLDGIGGIGVRIKPDMLDEPTTFWLINLLTGKQFKGRFEDNPGFARIFDNLHQSLVYWFEWEIPDQDWLNEGLIQHHERCYMVKNDNGTILPYYSAMISEILGVHCSIVNSVKK